MLTITSNDAQFMVTGGDAELGLLGAAPTTSGDSITGSTTANLTITAGNNDTLDLQVNGRIVAVTLAAGTYTADSLAAEVQKKISAAISSRHERDHVRQRPRFLDRSGGGLPQRRRHQHRRPDRRHRVLRHQGQ